MERRRKKDENEIKGMKMKINCFRKEKKQNKAL